MPWLKGTTAKAWRIMDASFVVIADALNVPVDELRAYILEGKEPPDDAAVLDKLPPLPDSEPISEERQKEIIVSDAAFSDAKAISAENDRLKRIAMVAEIKVRQQNRKAEAERAKRNRNGIFGAMKALVTNGTPLPVVPEPEPKLDPPSDGTGVRKIEVPLVPGKSPKYRLRDEKGYFLKRSGVGFTAEIAFAWKGSKLQVEQVINRRSEYADLVSVPLPHSEW